MEELLDTKLEQKLDQKLDEKLAVFETKFDYKLALLEARIDQKFEDFAVIVKKGFDELHEKFDQLTVRVEKLEDRARYRWF